MTDWEKLHGRDLLEAVDTLAIKKFGQSIMSDPEVIKIASQLIVETMRATAASGLRDDMVADIATRAAEIILGLRREIEQLKAQENKRRRLTMQSKQMARWAIAIMRKNGVEGLAMRNPLLSPLLGNNKFGMGAILKEMEQANPELRGNLRIVPVVVDIREMTEEEEASFRKTRVHQG